jgi:hypothetical protein
MTGRLTGDVLNITTCHGTSYGTLAWSDGSDVTFTFIEPANAGTSIMTLTQQQQWRAIV